MSEESARLKILHERQRKLEAWGYPSLSLSEFVALGQRSYQLYGDTGDLASNPFHNTEDTPAPEILAAYAELASLRTHQTAHHPKWLWLEECLIDATELALACLSTDDEIVQFVDKSLIPFTDQQKALLITWNAEHQRLCEQFATDEPSDATDRAYATAMLTRAQAHLHAQSRARTSTALAAREQLRALLASRR